MGQLLQFNCFCSALIRINVSDNQNHSDKNNTNTNRSTERTINQKNCTCLYNNIFTILINWSNVCVLFGNDLRPPERCVLYARKWYIYKFNSDRFMWPKMMGNWKGKTYLYRWVYIEIEDVNLYTKKNISQQSRCMFIFGSCFFLLFLFSLFPCTVSIASVSLFLYVIVSIRSRFFDFNFKAENCYRRIVRSMYIGSSTQ